MIVTIVVNDVGVTGSIERKPSYILMKKKVITKLCMSPRTHATTKQGKEKKQCHTSGHGKEKYN